MKKLLLLILVLTPFLSKSQDLIVFRNGDKVNCKITKVDSLNIYYNFQKGERSISSYVAKNEIRSYQLFNKQDSLSSHNDSIKTIQNSPVIIDTSVYVKHSFKWINMITYSQKYGIHANGWALQYYGYVLKKDSKWIFPCVFGLESFTINTNYFSQFNYQSANISYWMAGISPFRKLNDYFYINLGLQLLVGSEQLKDFNNNESDNVIFGIAPSQGIYFIPKSKFGITLGLGLYEKLLTSEVYQNDLGFRFELGIKF
jgi:hypothetical protein